MGALSIDQARAVAQRLNPTGAQPVYFRAEGTPIAPTDVLRHVASGVEVWSGSVGCRGVDVQRLVGT